MNYTDDIRLEQFRQMKKEIRGSGQYLIVGIDAAKKNTKRFYTTLSAYAKIVLHTKMRGIIIVPAN
jgi:hypothetical protein